MDLVEEKSGARFFDNGLDFGDVAAVMVSVTGNNEGFSGEFWEFGEGKSEKVAVVGDITVDKVAADDENVGVLLGEPGEGGAGEGDGLLVTNVEIGNKTDSVASE